MAQLFCDAWGINLLGFIIKEEHAPHESKVVRLDCAKLKSQIEWHPCWNVQEAVKHTVNWYKVWYNKGNLLQEMEHEFELYLNVLA